MNQADQLGPQPEVPVRPAPQFQDPAKSPDSSIQNSESSTPPIMKSKGKPSGKLFLVLVIVLFMLIGITAAVYLLFFQPDKKINLQEPNGVTGSTPKTTNTPAHYQGNVSIELADLTDSSYSGKVTRIYEESVSTYIVEAALPDPNENEVYEFWLIHPEKGNINVGNLLKVDEKYSLRNVHYFDNTQSFQLEDLSNTVAVTLETVDDEIMETKILEGTFTQ